MNSRQSLIFGSLFGFVAIALGAFGAHAWKDSLSPEQMRWLETGTRYLILHGLILVFTFFFPPSLRLIRMARAAFTVGAILFSGSLFGMALGNMRWLGAVAPVGGLSLMAGWLCLLLYGISLKRARS